VPQLDIRTTVNIPAGRYSHRSMGTLPEHTSADDRCPCGAQLLRESSSTLGVTRQIALCSSPECGRIGSPANEDDALRRFLIGKRPSHPDAPPWLRAFLTASRIPGTDGWRAAGEACYLCRRADLVVRFSFRAVSLTPESVLLCLSCGAVTARYIRDGHINSATGSDWTGLTGPAGDFRRAIHERRALADSPGEGKRRSDLWDD
jgi:hypothetical protein